MRDAQKKPSLADRRKALGMPALDTDTRRENLAAILEALLR